MTKEEVLNNVAQKTTPPTTTLPGEIPAWAKELIEDNRMMKAMLGDNKIKSWEESQKDHSQKYAKLKKWNGKVIVGWGKLDYSNFQPKASSTRDENVFIHLSFMDGTTEKVNYIDFINVTEHETVKIIKYSGSVCQIEFSDGNTVGIETKFLNS